MWRAVPPAASRYSSVARCRIVPLPPEPKLYWPGLAFSMAMKSRLLVALTLFGFTTSTMGVAPRIAIGVKSLGMSKGRDFSTLRRITTLFDTMPSVVPSGAERASVCSPSTPPAPGWFSTTTDAFSALDSAGCAARVIASTPEPVALGSTSRTTGSACANSGRPAAVARALARQARRDREGCMRVSFISNRGSAHDAACAQLRDVGVTVPGGREQLAAVFAQLRRLQAHAQALAFHGDGEEGGLHGLAGFVAVRQHDGGQAAGGEQVLVGQQVLGPADRRERQAGFLHRRRQVRGTAVRQPLPQGREQARALLHALVVGGEVRLGLQVGECERVAEGLPLRVAHRREEDLFAVLDGEHVVHGP